VKATEDKPSICNPFHTNCNDRSW